MIRAVIADDSSLFRTVLKKILEAQNSIEVVAAATNGQEALDMVKTHHPDILILDYLMPNMDGLETLKVLMKEHPLPVLMLSALTKKGAAITVRALEVGAADYFSKPVRGEYALEKVSAELLTKVETIVEGSRQSDRFKVGLDRERELRGQGLEGLTSRPVEVIGVGSSTGGVQAAIKIVSGLPANIKPMIWVQHIPASFTSSFAERLNSHAKFLVKEAEDGETLSSGVCYVAKAGQHVTVIKRGENYAIKYMPLRDRKSLHCPSCDELFESIAKACGTKALGVILTGMGNDGTQGLLALKAAGGFVVGQTARSSVVYGMVKSAQRAGAVDMELDLDDLAEAIICLGGVEKS